MATPIRMQCSWQVGSMLPRDRFTITPHFTHTQIDIGDTDWQALVDDLATGLKAWELAPTAHELTVKAYNLNDPEPRRPKAIAIRNANQSSNAAYMREVALALSYSGGDHGPSKRGRLYIPHVKMSNAAPGVRPTQTEREKVGALVPIFTALGGANVDWVVHSPTRDTDTPVSKWYVDDEWDVQRRRGDRPTARTSGTASE
jgi:hypothetical protein